MTTASDKPATPAKRAPRKPAAALAAKPIETVEAKPAVTVEAKPVETKPEPVKPAPVKAAKPAAPKPVVAEPAPAKVEAPVAAAPEIPVPPAVEAPAPVAVAPAVPSEPTPVPTPSQPPIDKVSQMTATPTFVPPTFKGYDEITAFGKANIDAMIQANTVFSKGLEAISKEFIALTQAHMESTAAAAKAIFAAKTLKDVVELNAAFHKTNFDKIVANSTKLGELGTKVATDAFAPISARVTSVVEKAAKPAA